MRSKCQTVIEDTQRRLCQSSMDNYNYWEHPNGSDTNSLNENPSTDSATALTKNRFIPSSCLRALPELTDVVILGADPPGLILACELARRQVDFILLDTRPRPTSRTVSIVLTPRTLEILSDFGIAEAAIVEGKIVRGAQIHTNRQTPIEFGFWRIPTPFPFMLILPQARLVELLLQRLAVLGHTVFRPVAAWKLEIETSHDALSKAPAWQADAKDVSSVTSILEDTNAFGNRYSSLFPPSAKSESSPAPSQLSTATLNSQDDNANTVKRRQTRCPDETCFTTDAPPEARLSASPTFVCRRPPMLQQTQPLLDIDRSLQHYGCLIQVRSLEPQDALRASSTDIFSNLPVIRSRYIVGCDGKNSCVRQALQLPLIPQGPTFNFYVADVQIQLGEWLDSDRIHIVQHYDELCVLIPLRSTALAQSCWRVVHTRPADHCTSGEEQCKQRSYSSFSTREDTQTVELCEIQLLLSKVRQKFWGFPRGLQRAHCLFLYLRAFFLTCFNVSYHYINLDRAGNHCPESILAKNFCNRFFHCSTIQRFIRLGSWDCRVDPSSSFCKRGQQWNPSQLNELNIFYRREVTSLGA